MKKKSTTSNTREDQIIPWVNYDKRDDKEYFIVLDSSFPKYRWDNIKIKDKKEFFIWEIPNKFKDILQDYHFDFHTKKQSSIYDKLYSLIRNNYNFKNIDSILDEIAEDTAHFFIYECKRGNCRPNRYMYAVDYISRSSYNGEGIINLDIYTTDQFTFKFMTNLYNKLKSINNIFPVKNFGDINRLVPFLNSIGLGGFIIVRKEEKNIFLFSQLNRNINSSELCHFSYEKTFMPIDMEDSDDNLTPLQRCLFRALDKDNGITLDSLSIQVDYGICDFGLIYNERFEFEICSYIVINTNDDSVLEELRDRYLALANESKYRTLAMHFIDAEDISSFLKTYKATPESIEISKLLNTRLNIKLGKDKDKPIKVFISYSWDSYEHKKWVLDLANNLTKNGVFIFLDQYDLKAGKDMIHFMENSIKESDKVLLIMTPTFKDKVEKREHGTGYEASIITSEIFYNHDTEKFIPIIKEGERDKCTPNFIKSRIYIDMSNDVKYSSNFEELLRTIYDKPKIMRPPIGKRPLL